MKQFWFPARLGKYHGSRLWGIEILRYTQKDRSRNHAPIIAQVYDVAVKRVLSFLAGLGKNIFLGYLGFGDEFRAGRVRAEEDGNHVAII